MFDTIAAISTPIGTGAVSIIKVSGEESVEIVQKIFKAKNNKKFVDIKTHTITYGDIVCDAQIIDSVLVTKMLSPRTYTGEDVVEINSHGGISITNSILQLLLQNGARLAQNGEFTKRAFLNGKIDLVQAEGISQLIYSKTDKANEANISLLNRNLSDEIDKLKAVLLSLLSDIEVNILYPEYETVDMTISKIKKSLKDIKDKLVALSRSHKKSQILNDGLKVAIVGKTNVGKSMLLNALVNDNIAIVTDIAGTTRDTIQKFVNIDGIPVMFIDTAGIRDADDTVEKIGIGRSVDALNSSDVVLFVVDGSNAMTLQDDNVYKMVEDKNLIVVANKLDISDKKTSKLFGKEVINISAKTLNGIKELEDKIVSYAKINDLMTSSYVNARHKSLIDTSVKSIDEALQSIGIGMSSDIVQIDIKNAWESLAQITGESISEEILDEIFANFCLGK